MDFYQFSVPTRIVFQEGLATDFAHECELLGVDSLFLISDSGLQSLGLIEPIKAHLQESGISILGEFYDVPADGSVSVIESCAELVKKEAPKAILAIGGGSVLDTAKGVNLLWSLGGNLKEDYSGSQTITQDLNTLIVIPTTAGTGSEVTEAMVIFDEESQSKLSFVDRHLLPDLAILDPTLTTGLPAKLTAATAMDALTHAMESMMSVQKGPVTDALAKQAITLIAQNLIPAIQDGSHIEARSALMVASNLAGMAFNHSMVGVVHAVAHSIGAVEHMHHGTANALFLAKGLEYNQSEAKEAILQMAEVLKLEKSPNAVIQWVESLILELNKLCGFPKNLKEAGLKEESLAKVVELSLEDGAGFYNPRPLEEDEILDLLKRCL